MRTTVPIQLVGGPYDGEAGMLTAGLSALPESLFVWTCSDCAGIHWSAEVQDDAQSARYSLAETGPNDAGLYDYLYAQLAETDLLSAAREMALA